MLSPLCMSVVCNVGAPYSVGWNFRRFFVRLPLFWPSIIIRWKYYGDRSRDHRQQLCAFLTNFLSLPPDGSQERLILLSYSNFSIKGTEILGFILYLSLLRPAIFCMCVIWRKKLLFSTLILGLSWMLQYILVVAINNNRIWFILCALRLLLPTE